jgi:hypothetical protein
MKSLISKGFIALALLISQFSTAFAQNDGTQYRPWYNHRPMPSYRPLPPNTGMYQQGGFGYEHGQRVYHAPSNPQASAGKAFIGIGVALLSVPASIALNRLACEQPITQNDGKVMLSFGITGLCFIVSGGVVLGTAGNNVSVRVPINKPGGGKLRPSRGKHRANDPFFNFP